MHQRRLGVNILILIILHVYIYIYIHIRNPFGSRRLSGIPRSACKSQWHPLHVSPPKQATKTMKAMDAGVRGLPKSGIADGLPSSLGLARLALASVYARAGAVYVDALVVNHIGGRPGREKATCGIDMEKARASALSRRPVPRSWWKGLGPAAQKGLLRDFRGRGWGRRNSGAGGVVEGGGAGSSDWSDDGDDEVCLRCGCGIRGTAVAVLDDHPFFCGPFHFGCVDHSRRGRRKHYPWAWG